MLCVPFYGSICDICSTVVLSVTVSIQCHPRVLVVLNEKNIARGIEIIGSVHLFFKHLTKLISKLTLCVLIYLSWFDCADPTVPRPAYLINSSLLVVGIHASILSFRKACTRLTTQLEQ